MDLTLPTSQLTVSPGKLICVGRNYAAHAAEMKGEVPTEPILFLKPSTALVGQGGRVLIPPMTNDVHHEVELVVVIGMGGKDIPVERAHEHIDGYAVGLDMTARDLQDVAKKKGLPWSVAKGFDTFAPLGPITASSEIPDPQALDVTLRVNDEVRQQGSTRDMIFPVHDLVAYCSRIFTLMAGDLIFTGTPEGVGPVRPGDVLEATITGLQKLRITVKAA